MRYSKPVLTVIVVLVILSLTFTSVSAQTPVGEYDEDGDLVMDIFSQVDVGAARELPDLENLADYSDFAGTERGVSVDAVPVFPVGGENVYTKFPTFKFSEDPGALKYRIEVYNTLPYPDVLVYTFKGPPDCEAGVCELTPTIALKPIDLTLSKGVYSWHVQSKALLSGWGEWSGWAYFPVIKNGFNSTFTTLDNKWNPVYGTWTITSTGFAKTKGEVFLIHSAIEKHTVTEGFVYEVKMKHKDDLNASNRLFFLGYPTPLNFEKNWYNGYIFFIRNNSAWQLVRRDVGGEALLTSGNSSYIKPYDWNIVTVMVGDPFIDYWINGAYIGFVTRADSYEMGYVGFGAFSNFGNEAFLVDYAKLNYTSAPPYPWPWSVSTDNQRDPAFEMRLTEAELGKDLTILP